MEEENSWGPQTQRAGENPEKTEEQIAYILEGGWKIQWKSESQEIEKRRALGCGYAAVWDPHQVT